MTIQEFSDQFDVRYNNITSNQAPGLNEYEKSIFLTQAEKEIVKNYFTANSKGNTLGQGFDDSAKRQADFSVLMKTALCVASTISGSILTPVKKYTCSSPEQPTVILYDSDITFTNNGTPYAIANGTYIITNGIITISGTPDVIVTVTGFPYVSGTIVIADDTLISSNGKIDDRSFVYAFPSDAFIIVNETIKTTTGKYLQVIPLKYDQYTMLMSKPFKRPLKNQAWRLINSGTVSNSIATKKVEIIVNAEDTISTYSTRYIRTPKPIILVNIGTDGLSIDGQSTASTECEIDPILHEDILQRAVELAKIAWQGDVQTALVAGQRSE